MVETNEAPAVRSGEGRALGRVRATALAAVAAALATFAGMIVLAGVEPDAPTAGLSVVAAALVYLIARLWAVADALARSETDAVLLAGAGLGRSSYRELLEEKRRVLSAIKELDFDHAMGKLSDEDYDAVRRRYEQRAAQTLAALERPEALHPWARALARGEVAPAAAPATCAGCGRPVEADARFCKHCGTQVAT